LFDVTSYSRREIGEILIQAGRYQPTVVGVSPSFIGQSDVLSDSLLMSGIKSCRVVLSALISNNQIIRADSKFLKYGVMEGVWSYLNESGKVTHYIPFYEDEKMQMLSFPTMIGIEYLGPERFEISDFSINTVEEIKYNDKISFKVLDSAELVSPMIKGKIVIFDNIPKETLAGSSGIATAQIILNMINAKQIASLVSDHKD